MAKATIPSVLAFEKKLVPSDGRLYETIWANRHQEAQPLVLVEKSVRGTISHRLKQEKDQDKTTAKLESEIEKANPQTVDSCSLSAECDTLKLSFTLKILGHLDKPSACNNEDFLSSYQTVVQNYAKEHQFTELAKRYALNIANGRFFWRNRVGAEQLEVVVKIKETSFTFNGFDYSLKSFDKTDEKIDGLAKIISNALCAVADDDNPYVLLEIDAYALIGKAQEVYPSEEMVMNKGDKDKSKILYAVKGIASLHSQKIGNAIRTIDTWYPDFNENNHLVIAAEPYGAVTNLGKAYRTPKADADFFTLFDKWALGGQLSETEQHYVMAVLVRGGVFGKSAKE